MTAHLLAAGRLVARRQWRTLLDELASWQLERISMTSQTVGCRRRSELVLVLATRARRCR